MLLAGVDGRKEEHNKNSFSALEAFLAACPEECATTCFHFTGHAGLANIACSSSSLFRSCQRLHAVWFREHLWRHLAQLVGHAQLIPLKKQNCSISTNGKETPRVVSAWALLVSIGIEMQKWRYPEPREEARQSFPALETKLRRKNSSVRRQRSRADIITVVPSRHVALGDDYQSYNARSYLETLHSLCLNFDPDHTLRESAAPDQAPPHQRATSPRRQRRLSGSTSRVIEPSSGVTLPLVAYTRGELYATNFCTLSRSMPPLRWTAIPTTVGFWPKPLVHGAVAQFPIMSEGTSKVSLVETRGTSGRALVACAAWVSVYMDPRGASPDGLSGELQLSYRTLKQSENLEDLNLCVRRYVTTRSTEPAARLLPVNTAGFMAVALRPSAVWPYKYEGKDRGAKEVCVPSVAVVALLSISQPACRNAVDHHRARHKRGGSHVPISESSSCGSAKGTPVAFVSFPMLPNESVVDVDAIVVVRHGRNRAEKEPDRRPASLEFQSQVSCESTTELQRADFQAIILVATDQGRILCTRPSTADEDHDTNALRPDEVTEKTWSDLYAKLSIYEVFSGQPFFDEYCNPLPEQCYDQQLPCDTTLKNLLQATLRDHGFASVAELHALTLSRGVKSSVVRSADPDSIPKAVRLLGYWDGKKLDSGPAIISVASDRFEYASWTASFVILFRLFRFINHSWVRLMTRRGGRIAQLEFHPTSCIAVHSNELCPMLTRTSLKEILTISDETAPEEVLIDEWRSGGFDLRSVPTVIRALNETRWAVVVSKIIVILDITSTSIKQRTSLQGHSCPIYACEFDNVRRLVSIDQGEQLIVWDSWTCQKLFGFPLFTPRTVKPESTLYTDDSSDFTDIYNEQEDDDEFEEKSDYSTDGNTLLDDQLFGDGSLSPAQEESLVVEETLATPPLHSCGKTVTGRITQHTLESRVDFPDLAQAGSPRNQPKVTGVSWSQMAASASGGGSSGVTPPQSQQPWKDRELAESLALQQAFAESIQIENDRQMALGIFASLHETDDTFGVVSTDAAVSKEASFQRQKAMDRRNARHARMGGLLNASRYTRRGHNPQSRAVSSLSVTPTRLSVLYKNKRIIQSWKL